MKKLQKEQNKGSKRLPVILSAVVLALLLLAAGLVWGLLSRLPKAPAKTGDLEGYLAESWPVFQLRAWDPETGALELDYPLRFSYAQMEKYGASLEELRELPTGNLATVGALKTAALAAVGVRLGPVTVYGRTTDGQLAYTVLPDGSVTACWE